MEKTIHGEDFETFKYKLKVLNDSLPKLTGELAKERNFWLHSEVSRNIGSIFGNPTAWNSTAFDIARSYVSGIDEVLNSNYKFDTEENWNLRDSVKSKFEETQKAYKNTFK